MAGAETARLVAELDLKDNFSKGLGQMGRNVDQFSRKIASSRASAVALGTGIERIAEKGISILGNAIGDGIQGALTLERTMNATQAVITSTGGAAGVSAAQIRDMAESLEDLTGADDKTIQQGENLLLTFTKIGRDTFPRATKAMVNFAIAMNKGDASTADFDNAAIQLGKALQDPVKGVTALRKAGVTFDADQQKQIKTLVKAGKVTQAQAIILRELEKEFGKAGAAANQGFAGDLNRYNDSIEDAKIAVAQGLIPALGEVARELTTVFRDPTTMSNLRDFGKNIGQGIKGAVAFAKSIPWDQVGKGLSIAAAAAKTVVDAFTSLPPWVQAAVISGWGLNKLTGGALGTIFSTLASGLIKGVLGMNAGVVNINAGVVNGPGGGGGLPGGIPTAAALIPIAAAVATSVIASIQVHEKTNIPGLQQAGLTRQEIAAELIHNNPAEAQTIIKHTGIVDATEHLDSASAKLAAAAGKDDRPKIPFTELSDAGKKLSQAVDRWNVILSQREDRPKIPPPKEPTGDQSIAAAFGKTATAIGDSFDRAIVPTTNAVDALRDTTGSGLANVHDSTLQTGVAVDQARGQISTSGSLVAGAASLAGYNAASASTAAGYTAASASYGAAAGIESVIRSSRPIIDVAVNISATTIQKTVTVTDRNGPYGGSAIQDNPNSRT